MSGLASRVAIVTGSSSGLGGGIALAHAAQGTRIIICADTKPIARTYIVEVTEIPTPEPSPEKYGENRVIFVKTDVRDSEQ